MKIASRPRYMKRATSGEPTVVQHTLANNYSVTFNPDWNRFCVHEPNDPCVLATFKGDSKGFTNAIYYARRANLKRRKPSLT